MKILLLAIIPLITFAKPSDSCSVYEMQGVVRAKEHELHLVIAEKTMSEKSMPVDFKEENKLYPYVNRAVSASFEINAKTPQTGVKILKIENPKDIIIDVLNQNQKTTYRKVKDIKCSK
jgi:hypothetical protein